jgi:peptidoglycan/LPS O-acetylase OafA/YrhL
LPFIQYLGHISFSLYLLHFQLLVTAGHWIVPRCMTLTGGRENGTLGFQAGLALSMVLWLPLVFSISDLFTRYVDEKSVKLAKWLCAQCFLFGARGMTDEV